MIIKSISIKNFRGIKNLDKLDFGSLCAIVGKNDAGKSTVLHAINSFYNDTKLCEEDRYYGAGVEETVIELFFDGAELETVPKVLLDESGQLHVKKACNGVGESYKSTIIVMDFINENYKNIMQLTTSKQTSLFRQMEMNVETPYTKENIFELINKIIANDEAVDLVDYEIKSSMLKGVLKELYPQYSLFLADTSLDTGATSFQNQFKKIVTNAIETHIEDFNN